MSPDVEVVAAAYRRAAEQLPELLPACASGRGLVGYGYPQDVAIAAEINASRSVPGRGHQLYSGDLRFPSEFVEDLLRKLTGQRPEA